MACDMRLKLTAIGLLAFAAFIAAPARSISPAIPQDDSEVHVHGSGADFVFNSLQKYGASKACSVLTVLEGRHPMSSAVTDAL